MFVIGTKISQNYLLQGGLERILWAVFTFKTQSTISCVRSEANFKWAHKVLLPTAPDSFPPTTHVCHDCGWNPPTPPLNKTKQKVAGKPKLQFQFLPTRWRCCQLPGIAFLCRNKAHSVRLEGTVKSEEMPTVRIMTLKVQAGSWLFWQCVFVLYVDKIQLEASYKDLGTKDNCLE